jgi:hypothetical protein
MTNMVHIKPAEGRVVKLPPDGKRTLPAEGAMVPHNLFVRRLLADGDAVVVPAQASAPTPAPEAAGAGTPEILFEGEQT